MKENDLIVPPPTGIIAEPDPIGDVLAMCGFASGNRGMATNFTGDNLSQMKFAGIATSGATMPGGDMLDKEIPFVYWFIHAVEILDSKTGEVNIAPRVVLLDKSLNGYHFVSQGVAQSLAVMIKFLGKEALPAWCKATIRRRKTRAGYYVLYLEPVIPAK